MARPSGGEPIKLSTADPRTKANRAAFLERVQQREALWERSYNQYLSGARTPRERRFVRDLTNFWRDATWMTLTGQFPDGQPLRKQNVHHLELWNVFLIAMRKREAGETTMGTSEESAEQGAGTGEGATEPPMGMLGGNDGGS